MAYEEPQLKRLELGVVSPMRARTNLLSHLKNDKSVLPYQLGLGVFWSQESLSFGECGLEHSTTELLPKSSIE